MKYDLYSDMMFLEYNLYFREGMNVRDSLPRYMSIKQTLVYFNIKSRNTLKKNYIAKGLPVVIINGTKRIDQLDADKFMEAHKV